MSFESRRTRVRVDRDGVKTIETSGVRSGLWLAAVALAVVAVGFLFLRPSSQIDDPEEVAGGELSAPADITDAPKRARPPQFRPVRRDGLPEEPARPPADARGHQANGTTAEDAAAATESDGDEAPTGIALFPPPGTDPIKRGLIVPDDFVLPPGYVRHYQATDDGQRLPAILMFHPDYDWVDASGERIEVPADQVVPPEFAPAGMPLQSLDVPDVVVPMIEEPGEAEAGN